jgi:predicted CXXCH cytochrome family protein
LSGRGRSWQVWGWRLRWQAALLLLLLCGWLGSRVLAGQRVWLLPGETSDGHHVIEAECGACHSGFEPPSNEACTRCHRQELAEDTHPVATFDDPRWAEDLTKLDARRCRSCHAEHARNARGVSAAPGLCFGCHDDVVERRPSHRGFAPTSCSDGGCHNYHDNSTLNVAFLRKRLGWPATHAHEPARQWRSAAAPPVVAAAGTIEQRWQQSEHARRDVGCPKCHGEGAAYRARPDEAACGRCHGFEVDSFRHGKHGAPRALGLPALQVAAARRPMRPEADGAALSCSSCHDVQALDTGHAAADACLGCHADEHSLSYRGAPHAATGVTCATCHLPRMDVADPAAAGGRVAVNHNNSFTFEPRDRMARMVCLQCHSLELALSSLYDETAVRTNFAHAPRGPHKAVQMLLALPAQRKP